MFYWKKRTRIQKSVKRRALSVLGFIPFWEKPVKRQCALCMEEMTLQLPLEGVLDMSGLSLYSHCSRPAISKVSLIAYSSICFARNTRNHTVNRKITDWLLFGWPHHSSAGAQIRNFDFLTESGVLYNLNGFIMNKLFFSVRPYSLQVYFFTCSIPLKQPQCCPDCFGFGLNTV